MRLTIGIVAERIGHRGGGVETYERSLIKGLMAQERPAEEADRFRVFNYSRRCLNDNLPRQENFDFKAIWGTGRLLDNALGRLAGLSVGLPLQLAATDVDVVHFCTFPTLLLPGRFIITAHDMAPFTQPELFPPTVGKRIRLLLGRAMRRADAVIAVSGHTAREVHQHLGVPQERIRVIHSGVGAMFAPVTDKERIRQVLQRHGIAAPYVLHVGKIQARKNIAGLLTAYKALVEDGLPHQLVLAGPTMWESTDMERELRRRGLEDRVLLTGYVPDGDLPALYSGAELFAFPSLYEGFGHPPLESMACGTPVVASGATSLAEVCGTAALSCDPADPRDLANAMHRALTDQELRRTLVHKGLERAGGFRWEATAQKTRQLYHEVAGDGATP